MKTITIAILISVLGALTIYYPAESQVTSNLIGPEGLPQVQIMRTQEFEFPSETDSNSPLFWIENTLHAFNSAGKPVLSRGSDVRSLQVIGEAKFDRPINGSRWMEAVVQDETNGLLYGYYHNEPAFSGQANDRYSQLCPGSNKTAPRIGAAVSKDGGLTWKDMEIILEAPHALIYCNSKNFYFTGGIGDVSVMLDHEQQYLYFFFGNYSGNLTEDHGVGTARMLWADRDNPSGKVFFYNRGTWTEPGVGGFLEPIFPAEISFHETNARGFWGPSIHWNTHLKKWVMLMNKSKDSSQAWSQEGIYITFSDNLSDPKSWSPPYKILEGGHWYPQVVGATREKGTDKLAGQFATLFMKGKSIGSIIFHRPGGSDSCSFNGTSFRCR